MEVINFVSDGIVGVNLSVEEAVDGKLTLCRTYQSAHEDRTKPPEVSHVNRNERYALGLYLLRTMTANMLNRSG